MKLSGVVSKDFLLALFVWICLILLLTNPTLQAIDLTYSSSQVVASMPESLGGLSLQGSLIVSQNTQVVSAVNQTSGQQVQAYQVTVVVFNLMSFALLFLPWIVFAYFKKKP